MPLSTHFRSYHAKAIAAFSVVTFRTPIWKDVPTEISRIVVDMRYIRVKFLWHVLFWTHPP